MTVDLQPTLQGEWVLLRPLRADDWAELFAVAADPLIWEQHPARDRYREPVFREFFDEGLACGGAFAVVERTTGRIIGSSRYFGWDPGRREVEIGWTFLARAYWGGRYNGEMKRLMLDHAFQFADRVVFLVGPDNVRSQRAVERIGGVRAGTRTDARGRESVLFEIRRPASGHPANGGRSSPRATIGSALVAFVALPGIVGYLVPWLLRPAPARAHAGGVVIGGLGLALLLWCVADFFVAGRGTLAPWDPPRRLVVAGPYRYSRNPMYLGVLTVLLGWVVAYPSPALLVYGTIVAVAFHLRVRLGEEPFLAGRYGSAWEAYRQRVPRWLGRAPGPPTNQCRKPSGWIGRRVLTGMNRRHSALTDWGLAQVPVGATDDILDVGCGGGRTVAKLVAAAPRGSVTGVDHSAESVVMARAVNAPAIASGRVHVAEADVAALPFPTNAFDLATAVETHFWWPDLGAGMREVYRVLRPGGRVLVVAEFYNGGKHARSAQRLSRLTAIGALTPEQHRTMLADAGFRDVTVVEDARRGWICAIGTKADAMRGVPVSDAPIDAATFRKLEDAEHWLGVQRSEPA